LDDPIANTVFGFRLQVGPVDFITQLLNDDCIFEAPESDLATRLLRPGDTCIDAGCHVGYYTCLFAKLVGTGGRVFAFDANPQACDRTRANLQLNGLSEAGVIQAALADHNGTAQFYVSVDEQTGLSSLGAISFFKRIISVPRTTLEEFLNQRGIQHVRLLKVAVEGAEELVLRGAGTFLSDQRIDFLLMECYDERLRLLNSSTERVSGILRAAGYAAWDFMPFRGWAETEHVQSRGDCNYLFVSPLVTDTSFRLSIAGAVLAAGETRKAAVSESLMLQEDLGRVQAESSARQRRLDQLQQRLMAIENSRGWRMLNAYRRVRDGLLRKS
jgi:FkbM family methyltransferase